MRSTLSSASRDAEKCPSSTKNADGERDPELHQTRKGNVTSGIKRQFGLTKVRFRGLAKNTAHVITLFALSNLWVARHELLVMTAPVRPQAAK